MVALCIMPGLRLLGMREAGGPEESWKRRERRETGAAMRPHDGPIGRESSEDEKFLVEEVPIPATKVTSTIFPLAEAPAPDKQQNQPWLTSGPAALDNDPLPWCHQSINGDHNPEWTHLESY
uniref:Uncharacterized protein n=1 Tax=Myotis myotis TaxID=51298 RepID=A0A7J7TTP2_MYOMY|nr:hypothetical protein mMyoMyo1_008948 [Myotis myotis]